MKNIKNRFISILRWSEKYTKTDMVYLVTSSFWMNSNTIITTILSFILYIAFANLIPKEIYGEYQFIISIGSVIGAITLTGINSAITQAVARNKEGSFKKSIPIQLRWGILPSIISLFISAYYFLNNNPAIATSVMVVGILIPVLNAFNTYSAFILGKKDFKRAFFYGQILNFSYYPIMIFSLFFVRTSFALVAINFLVNTTLSIILYFLTIRFYKPNNQEDPETINFGKHVSLANILGTITLQLDNVLVFHFLGAIPLAIYAFATNIPDRFNGLFKNITNAALPKFSEKPLSELKNTIIQKTFRFTIFVLFGSIIYIILAPFLFQILFPQYESSLRLSQAYSLVLVLGSLLYLPGQLLIATKSYKEIYKYCLVNSIINTLCMFFGIYYFGFLGLIFGKGIANILNLFVLIFLIKNKKTKDGDSQYPVPSDLNLL